MESTFIEIVNLRKSNIIVGVICIHPSMDLADFNYNYLNKLLENISKEQKSIFLLGDFNVNLLTYNEYNETNEFLDSLPFDSLIPLILQPTRITSHSNTLINNVFSSVIDPDIISGNFTATISDHMPEFTIIPNMFGNISYNKSNTNFINKKDPILKAELTTKSIEIYSPPLWRKVNRLIMINILKEIEIISKTHGNIKSLISLKTVASSVPAVLSLDNGDTITNPYDIANAFNS